MVKHFQEHDKIKTHKFTSDVHLAHYFFPILKQCKQVTYAFKTPRPLPHPPKSLSSYYLGGNLQFCKCYCARGLQAVEKQPAGLGERGGWGPLPSYVSSTLQTGPRLASFSHQREGTITPFLQILELLPSRVPTSLLSGSYVTSHRVMATHQLIC